MTTQRYTLAEYTEYLRGFVGRVHFTEIHVHATWRPTIADYRKRGGNADAARYLVEAMRRTHVISNGWSDIAQHVTIDPDGYIWSGRDLTRAPASATGYNGNSAGHPFMFEMIGNFDAGCERLEGAQLDTATGLTRLVAELWRLGTDHIVFHREINATGKTCPGSGVDKAEFIAKVYGNKAEATADSVKIVVNDKLVEVGTIIDGHINANLAPVLRAAGINFAYNNEQKKLYIYV